MKTDNEFASKFVRLTSQVDELIKLCEQLKAENSSLKAAQQKLFLDNKSLVEKNNDAKIRVDQVIARLKASGSNS